MSTLIRTQIYIPSDIIEIAKAKAKAKKQNLSQYIREVLANANKTTKAKKAKIRPFNFGAGTPSDIATSHNNIYDQ